MSKQTKDTYEAWSARATRELKGKALESLNWKSSSGLSFHPYYSWEQGNKRFPVQWTRTGNEWDICESILVNEAKEANKQALSALNAGANALLFQWTSASVSPSELLDEIGLPYIQCSFQMPAEQINEWAVALRNYIDSKGFDSKSCSGFLKVHMEDASDGSVLANRLELLSNSRPIIQDLLPAYRTGIAHVALFANRGLHAAQELGMALYWYQYLLEQGFEQNELHLSCGRDFYTELVKFRIAGNLAGQIAKAYGKTKAIRIHGISSSLYMSDLDRYSNLLRLTTAAMSAVSGGANSVQLNSFSKNSEDSESFKSRITRNIQLVLLHETGIGDVRDAAAGSYFLEEMSFRLAEQTWEFFVSLQPYSGMPEFLRSTEFLKLIREAEKNAIDAVSSRKAFFLGVNQYPNTLEETPELPNTEEKAFAPLHLSGMFHHLKKEGKPQKALLLKKGNLAMRNAQAGFVANFLRCGNWELKEILWNDEALEKADLYVLCSSDDEYAEWVKSPLLREKNIAIAGNPGESEDEFRRAGVGHFIHVKSHLFKTLSQLANS
ncbi:MAG: hypothetical protein GC180_01690 [Bacteroidetes bacterium]|nr:hypothetical protein [Bacteroidota bacterium]